MNKLNDHRLANLEKEIQNKKQEFILQKECLEKKIFDLENQINSIKNKEIKKKTISCQTIEIFPQEDFENIKKEYEKKALKVFQKYLYI